MLQPMGVVLCGESDAGSCVYLGSVCGWALNCVCPGADGEHDNRCVRAASHYDSCLLYLLLRISSGSLSYCSKSAEYMNHTVFIQCCGKVLFSRATVQQKWPKLIEVLKCPVQITDTFVLDAEHCLLLLFWVLPGLERAFGVFRQCISMFSLWYIIANN